MDGNELKQIRVSLRLTQEEFAHRLGVTLCTVNRWENNRTMPSRLAKKQIQQLEKEEKLSRIDCDN